MTFLNNGFLFAKPASYLLNIVPEQVQVAWAGDRVLYSTNFGWDWQEYKLLPYADLASKPIVGGSFSDSSGYDQLFICYADRQYRKGFVSADANIVMGGWSFYLNYPNNAVAKVAKGPFEPVKIGTDGSVGYPNYRRYYARNIGETPSFIQSLKTNGTFNFGLYVKSGSFSVYDPETDTWPVNNKALAAASLGTGYFSGTLYLYLTNASGQFYKYLPSTDTFTLLGTIPGYTSAARDGLNYGIDLMRTQTNPVFLVATEKIWVSNPGGSAFTQKLVLTAPARGARIGRGNSNYMTVVTADGKIYVSHDQGSNWEIRYNNPAVEFMENDMFNKSGIFNLETFLK